MLSLNNLVGFGVRRGPATVLIELWGASGGGGTVLNTSLSREGGKGGIRAATFVLLSGTTLEYFVPEGGGGGQIALAATGGASGAGNGGNGRVDGGSHGSGAGGGAAGVRVGSDWLIKAGGGGGGAANDDQVGYDGAARSSGGSNVPSNTGGNTGSPNGSTGGFVSDRVGAGGGGGAEGGIGGHGSFGGDNRGRGGTALVNSTTHPGTIDTTAEAAMTPMAGGTYGRNSANASPGLAGRIRITVNGVVVLDSSTPGTGTVSV